LVGTRLAVDELAKAPMRIDEPALDLARGMGLVTQGVSLGSDSIVDIEVLCNGQPTGIVIEDAVCYGGAASRGDVVSFTRRSDGSFECHVGGGGSSSGATTVTVSGIVVGTGWMYP
jgi:hypothetical protein